MGAVQRRALRSAAQTTGSDQVGARANQARTVARPAAASVAGRDENRRIDASRRRRRPDRWRREPRRRPRDDNGRDGDRRRCNLLRRGRVASAAEAGACGVAPQPLDGQTGRCRTSFGRPSGSDQDSLLCLEVLERVQATGRLAGVGHIGAHGTRGEGERQADAPDERLLRRFHGVVRWLSPANAPTVAWSSDLGNDDRRMDLWQAAVRGPRGQRVARCDARRHWDRHVAARDPSRGHGASRLLKHRWPQGPPGQEWTWEITWSTPEKTSWTTGARVAPTTRRP